jgi:hypothetical protein
MFFGAIKEISIIKVNVTVVRTPEKNSWNIARTSSQSIVRKEIF